MVEYVLMVVLIALVVALAVPTVTNGITAAFNKVATFLNQ
jgi:Flp pilus assembly pilin Flp